MFGGIGLCPGPHFYQGKPAADPIIGFRTQPRSASKGSGMGSPFRGGLGLGFRLR